MNLVRILCILLLPTLLCGQSTRPYLLDLDDHPVEQHSRSFIVVDVVDSTASGSGGYGKVYTGMVNTGRELHFRGGLELVLKQALLRGIENRELTQARLVVHDVRIDEEVTPTREQRRLQLLASLELWREGRLRTIGPLLETQVQPGIDVTGGHAGALSKALGRLLDRFAIVLAEDDAGVSMRAYVREADLSRRPDGAYHSYADFRIGRVDTSVHLSARATRVQAELGELTFRAAYLEAEEDTPDRDRKVVWGYHIDGHSYLQVARKFHELTQDREGRTLVYLEGGLFNPEKDPGQLVLGALGGAFGGALGATVVVLLTSPEGETAKLFEVDLHSGALVPRQIAYAPTQVGGRTMLQSTEPPGGRKIEVHYPDGIRHLGPGEYLLLEPGEQVSFAAAGYHWQPVTRHLREGSDARPALYRLLVVDSGGIRIKKAGLAAAEGFRARIEAGRVEPAR